MYELVQLLKEIEEEEKDGVIFNKLEELDLMIENLEDENLLKKIVNSKSYLVRETICSNSFLTFEMEKILMLDEQSIVRASLAVHTKNKEVLRFLSEDEILNVVWRVAENENTEEEVLKELSFHYDEKLKMLVDINLKSRLRN